ncbi:response regulator [Thalassotalea euphylliae]|uniref:Sensory/regulatory protein RpfC n=1 Tax=Thalassotalea euphylliae TaxID=1655234 RepID=A0A3E0TWQ0_9GAMM|nr:response regulator [Thalassotalea euphylliae]REL28362.1 response regulator [Thalassotalea euphylliae]
MLNSLFAAVSRGSHSLACIRCRPQWMVFTLLLLGVFSGNLAFAHDRLEHQPAPHLNSNTTADTLPITASTKHFDHGNRKAQAIATELKYLDEVLTSSVLSYVFTGEQKWLARYREHKPQLEILVARLQHHPEASESEFIQRLTISNAKLLELEAKAIDLAKQTKRQQAMQVLNSDDYFASKDAFMTASLGFKNHLEQSRRNQQHAAVEGQGKLFTLNQQERDWLANTTIKVGVEHWPPFIFQQNNGELGGIAGGLLQSIAAQTGLKFEIVSGQWQDLLSALAKGEIDLIPDAYLTQARQRFGDFSRPYYLIHEKIFVLKENKNLTQLDDLANATIAIPRGYVSVEHFTNRFPAANILATESVDQSINAVLSGQADALLDAQIVMRDRIAAAGIRNLKMLDEEVVPPEPLHFLVGQQHPELLSIINKVLAVTDVSRLIKKNQHWLESSDVTQIQASATVSNLELYYVAIALVLVLLLIGTGVSTLMLRSDEKRLAERFGSTRFQRLVISGLVGLAVILLLIAFIVINNAEHKTKQVLGYNLNSLLASTHSRLNNWIDEERLLLSRLSSHSDLVAMVEQLLVIDTSTAALTRSPLQSQLRQFFATRSQTLGQQEFYILSPDMVSLSAMGNSELGKQHPLAQYYGEQLTGVLAGDQVFLPPIQMPSQVLSPIPNPTPTQSNQTRLFFAVPITDIGGQTIAILALAFDPSEEFSNQLATGFTGRTGETYAFNQQGRLISNVRFENQLKTIGLINAEQSPILTLPLRNPGKNLLTEQYSAQAMASWPLTEMAQSATRGFTSSNLVGYNDYRGVKVVGSWLWDADLNIGMAVEVDLEESVQLLTIFKYTLISMLCVALSLLFGCTLFTLKLGTRATTALSRSHGELECLVAERTSELQSNIDRTQTIIDNASDAIIIVNDQGIIDSFGPSAELMFGYSKAQVIGQPLSLLMELPFHHISPEDMFNGHIIDQLGIRADGSTFDIGISVSDFTFEGAHFFTGAVRDITIRKDAQRALEQAKNSAIEATKAKSDFLANMSHEIRTPMNAIIGMSYLALQTHLTDKQHDYINKIHGSADALLGIINDILDFSKIEAGKLTLEQAPFNLTETLDHVIETIALKSQQKGIELLIDLAPGLPTCLVGDSLRLGQILINLASNAVKFTEQGEIIIKIAAKEDSAQGLTLQFSVSDTGIGMTEAHLQRLFKSFSQADASTTRKYGGTGLGLTICKTLTEMMGGEIWVESEYQKGSTFSFTAQFDRSDEPVSRPKLAIADAADIKVLIVDDSMAAREILQTIAQSIGFNSVIAESAEHALQHIERAVENQQPFDIVLTDWKMPHTNGAELIKEILANHHSVTPKFIMLTAYDRDEMMAACHNLPISAYLTKPVSASTLLDANLQALGRSEKVTQQITTQKLDISSTEAIRGANVLLVEDNEINQQIATELLEMAHLNVDTAVDGQQAVDKVLANMDTDEQADKQSERLAILPYDVVLMDIQMPVMDGYQATMRIREHIGEERLPIIAMTANAMAGDRERCLEAGMNDHLTKPISPSEVFAMLSHWIAPKNQPLNQLLTTDRGINADTIAATTGVADKSLTSAQPLTENTSPLPAIAGLDTESALARIAGNIPLYLSLLEKFVTNHSQAISHLRQLLTTNDIDGAVRATHTLKGVTASIGATELSLTLAQLEQIIEQGHSYGAQLSNAEQAMANVIASIQSVSLPPLSSDETQPAEPVHDTATLNKLYQQLCEEVTDFDADAQETWRVLRKQLSTLLPNETESKLSRALSEYDFEQAEQYLPALAETINSVMTT